MIQLVTTAYRALTMACAYLCLWQYVLDAVMVVSTVVYAFVLFVALKKRTFSYSFTAITLATGVADILYGILYRALFVYPDRQSLRYNLVFFREEKRSPSSV